MYSDVARQFGVSSVSGTPANAEVRGARVGGRRSGVRCFVFVCILFAIDLPCG